MDATELPAKLRTRGAKFDNEVADLIERLQAELAEAREMSLDDKERDTVIEVLSLMVNGDGRVQLWTHSSIWNGLTKLAHRLKPKPPVEWHDVSVDGVVTGSIAVCNGWTLYVGPAYTPGKFEWRTGSPEGGGETAYTSTDVGNTIDAAKAAAVAWARGH